MSNVVKYDKFKEILYWMKEVRQQTGLDFKIGCRSRLASSDVQFSLQTTECGGLTFDMCSKKEAIGFLEGIISLNNINKHPSKENIK